MNRRRLIQGIAGSTIVALIVAGQGQPAGAEGTGADGSTGMVRGTSGLQVHVGKYREAGHVPDNLRPALAAAEELAERMPGDFGRPWFDEAAGVVVVDVATLRGNKVTAAIREQQSGADEVVPELSPTDGPMAGKSMDFTLLSRELGGKQVRQRSVRNSTSSLRAIEDELIEMSRLPDFQAENIWMTRIDPPNNRVIVTVDQLSDPLAAAVVQRYGTELVAVEVDVDETKPQPTVGRWADNPPFYGGSRINAPAGGCTDAFSWYGGSTNYMLTAGHCAPSGGSVSTIVAYMGTVTSGYHENWSTTYGTVYLTGQSTYRGDMALVTVKNGSSAGRIYRGNSESTSSAPVRGMMSSSSRAGDQFCTGGSSRKSDGSAGPGEICGWTVDVVGTSYEYASGHWYRNVVRSKSKTGWCNRPGDSGAPVYIVSSSVVYAKGILDAAGGGGSDYYGGLFDQCAVAFTDIYQAYYGFPGVIRTG